MVESPLAKEARTSAVATSGGSRDTPRAVWLRLLGLLALAVWCFWPDLKAAWHACLDIGDWPHGLAAPGLILLLVLQRRRELAAGAGAGSGWGFVAVLLGLLLLAVNCWPFEFGYMRMAAFVPVCGGIVLCAAGWRVLKLCLPMLTLLALSLPIGGRMYTDLTLRPERYGLAATALVLNTLPGVTVTRDNVDLDFVAGGRTSTIALGEPHRATALLATYATLGLYVIFARVRSAWEVTALLVCLAPLTLLCSLIRMLLWGLIAIYAQPAVIAAWPRIVTAVGALLVMLLGMVAAGWIVTHVFEAADDGGTEALDGAESQDAEAQR